MTARGGLDLEVLAARVDAARRHPGFPQARRRHCELAFASRVQTAFRSTLAADTGAFALGAVVTGLNRIDPDRGAPVSRTIAVLERGGFASATRARALVGQMADRGLIRVIPDPADRRVRRLEMTEAFLTTQRVWLAGVFEATSLIWPSPRPLGEFALAPGVLERFLASITRGALAGVRLYEGLPAVDFFLRRRHGYALMLQLAAAGTGEVELNRAGLADRCGMTAAHVSALLADAEAQGWLWRRTPSSRVVLEPSLLEQMDLWIARELANASLWIEAKLTRTSQVVRDGNAADLR